MILWWLALLGLATVVAVFVERLARRLLPLAILLRFSMAFPDRAPSRFAMARSAGNVRQLEARIESAHERGVDDDPARAAEQILGLVAALSAHDRKTRGHSERVRAFTDMLASELSFGPDDRDRLRWATLLHDIGKLRVPPRILNKPGIPDPHEWERLKEHPRWELGSPGLWLTGSVSGPQPSPSTTSGSMAAGIRKAWRNERSPLAPEWSRWPTPSR